MVYIAYHFVHCYDSSCSDLNDIQCNGLIQKGKYLHYHFKRVFSKGDAYITFAILFNAELVLNAKAENVGTMIKQKPSEYMLMLVLILAKYSCNYNSFKN
jgi:hypothetical protein